MQRTSFSVEPENSWSVRIAAMQIGIQCGVIHEPKRRLSVLINCPRAETE